MQSEALEDYVSEHGEALERAIGAAVSSAFVARAADPLAYVVRELSLSAGPTELREEIETLHARLEAVTAERDTRRRRKRTSAERSPASRRRTATATMSPSLPSPASPCSSRSRGA